MRAMMRGSFLPRMKSSTGTAKEQVAARCNLESSLASDESYAKDGWKYRSWPRGGPDMAVRKPACVPAPLRAPMRMATVAARMSERDHLSWLAKRGSEAHENLVSEDKMEPSRMMSFLPTNTHASMAAE